MKHKKPDLKNLPEVRVEWLDSSSRPGWNKLDDVLNEKVDLSCITVGQLICKDKYCVTVVHSVSPDTEEIHSPQRIPWKCITDYQEWPPQRRSLHNQAPKTRRKR